MSLKAPKIGASALKASRASLAPTGFVSFNTDLVGARLARELCEARPFIGYAISRNSRRRILPTGVIGNDSRNTMCLGTLYAVKFSLQ